MSSSIYNPGGSTVTNSPTDFLDVAFIEIRTPTTTTTTNAVPDPQPTPTPANPNPSKTPTPTPKNPNPTTTKPITTTTTTTINTLKDLIIILGPRLSTSNDHNVYHVTPEPATRTFRITSQQGMHLSSVLEEGMPRPTLLCTIVLNREKEFMETVARTVSYASLVSEGSEWYRTLMMVLRGLLGRGVVHSLYV
ncbi:hypothetical protein BJY04DRAFT_223425 [Aspergillus karnatakaensis]|uniref:uncharacterized protein n=1 Tax=Aspergillus karnatakaensis TaxID=1810916 RepID=UPI003CCE0593